MSQETNLDVLPPLPETGSETTVFEYFNHPYFFEGDVSEKFLDQTNVSFRKWMSLYKFFEDAQRCVNVYLEIFACLGCIQARVFEAFEKLAEETGQSPPIASEFTKPSDNDELESFSKRVEELFEWDKESDPEEKYFGPYLCIRQTNSMGKMKLMYDYKIANAKQPETAQEADGSPISEKVTFTHKRVATFLILLTSLGFEMEKWKNVFDYQWNLEMLIKNIDTDVPHAGKIAADRIFDELDKKLLDICRQDPSCNRILLVFEDTNRLVGEHFGYGCFLLRCVGSWLREKRTHDLRVAAVFAGTDRRINLFPSKNEDALERSLYSPTFNPQLIRSYHDRGCNINFPFFQRHESTGVDGSVAQWQLSNK